MVGMTVEQKMERFRALPVEEQERRYNVLMYFLDWAGELERLETVYFEQFKGDDERSE